MRFLNIYTVEGMNDVEITTINYQRNWCIRNAHLFCTENYNKSCSLINASPNDGCSDSGIDNDQFCETYKIMTESPTIYPTIILTDNTLPPTYKKQIFLARMLAALEQNPQKNRKNGPK